MAKYEFKGNDIDTLDREELIVALRGAMDCIGKMRKNVSVLECANKLGGIGVKSPYEDMFKPGGVFGGR